MKNMLGKMVLLAVGMMFMFMGQVQAFDYMADVDEVSRDPYKAYTLYCGMPWSDAKANFNNLPGWKLYQVDDLDDTFELVKVGGNTVKELIRVEEKMRDKVVRGFSIHFYTDSLIIAKKIYERLYNNICYNIGNPDYKHNMDDDVTGTGIKSWNYMNYEEGQTSIALALNGKKKAAMFKLKGSQEIINARYTVRLERFAKNMYRR